MLLIIEKIFLYIKKNSGTGVINRNIMQFLTKLLDVHIHGNNTRKPSEYIDRGRVGRNTDSQSVILVRTDPDRLFLFLCHIIPTDIFLIILIIFRKIDILTLFKGLRLCIPLIIKAGRLLFDIRSKPVVDCLDIITILGICSFCLTEC